jgi:hypothetical protein
MLVSIANFFSVMDFLIDSLKLFLRVVVKVRDSSSSVIAYSFMWSLENHLEGRKALIKIAEKKD